MGKNVQGKTYSSEIIRKVRSTEKDYEETKHQAQYNNETDLGDIKVSDRPAAHSHKWLVFRVLQFYVRDLRSNELETNDILQQICASQVSHIPLYIYIYNTARYNGEYNHIFI